MTEGMKIRDCFKIYTADQDKTSSPGETVARVKAKLAQAGLRVLERTVRIDNGRLDIPVFISECGVDAARIMPTKKQMGKGASPEQAEASAVMELVERFSFFSFRADYPFVKATFEDVSDRALPFEHLAISVHHDPEDLDRARQALDGLVLDWVPALNLTRNREHLIPFNWFFEINQFNGSSAGNALEEAAMQGLAEVVERHVSAVIARTEPSLPSIDPASLTNPAAVELVSKFEKQGIKLFLKDFSFDMGLPTVGGLAYDPANFPEKSELVYTAGTASDPQKALIRTLTELAQLGGDFNTKSNFEASGLPKYTDLAQAEYITAPAVMKPIGELPGISHDNIRVEIERAVEALARKGLEVYLVDVSHPALDTPAVYVIVPGAHFRERALGANVPFFAAKMLAEQEDPMAAATGLAGLERLYPDSYYIRFHQGSVMLNLGRPDKASKLLKSALELQPTKEDRAAALTYLGLAHQQMEEFEPALAALEESAKLDAERRDTFNLLGFCYFKTKQHEKAIASFKRVLELDPGSGIDYANIGSNYRELGRKDKALEYYGRALELDPSLDWVRENIKKLL